ncbi:MAG: SDR family NAD(P)-dependent oxidoreductase, partial [Verrucomicrobia bacterium]|nr:SDR family NAD(P)-dependent oxidoreductase [Verrucomicrobiota bacterium]
MSFINQVAVVTGASDGIGLETVRLLAGAGAKVMLNARGEARLNQVIRALRATGYEVAGVAGDITRPAIIRQVFQTTVRK